MPTPDRPRIEYRTPLDLLADVQQGRLRIPPFQRGFKWGPSDVIALFDSILRGFPIGNLVLWRRPAPAGSVRVGPLEVDAPDLDTAYWVVDGQQRVTSLVGALAAAEDTTDSRFRIYFDLDDARFHALGTRQLPSAHWIPVSRLSATAPMLSWIRDNADWMTAAHIELADSAAQAIRDYPISVYVVNSDDEDALREMFDRLNGAGKSLTKAEVFHALHSGLAGDSPFDLKAVGAVSAQLSFGALPARLALQCVLAYRHGDIFREDLLDEFSSAEDRADTFREVAACLRAVVEFLQGEAGIPHRRLLPYSHVIPVLVRFVKEHGEPGGRQASLLRRWVWRDAIDRLMAGGVSVAIVRRAITAAGSADPYEAARALLAEVTDRRGFEPDLWKVGLNHAATKINLLGLLSTGPQDFTTGQPLDLPAVLESGGAVRTIVDAPATELAGTFANRIVVPKSLTGSIRSLLLNASNQIASSYVVDQDALASLARGDADSFLELRADQLALTIGRHVNAMAEWGARDGRSLADIVRSVA
ncbi:DUF262 domain-containing protein [Dactylosporangium sp. NPDC051541]|uniref:DUF262 domain-containing protein n=1 Tax=Dactylosporangium sp. NPDC051541 TaxID=3363977 RepID=UPI00379FAD22